MSFRMSKGRAKRRPRREIFYTLHPDRHVADLFIVKDFSSYLVRNDMVGMYNRTNPKNLFNPGPTY
jgi:hypothetical protein